MGTHQQMGTNAQSIRCRAEHNPRKYGKQHIRKEQLAGVKTHVNNESGAHKVQDEEEKHDKAAGNYNEGY
jgi:hypothetical protein